MPAQAAGVDDLDLDGNWTVEPARPVKAATKVSKRAAEAAAEAEPSPFTKKGSKKRKKAPEEAEVSEVPASEGKKKRRGKGAKEFQNGDLPAGQSAADLQNWAAQRLLSCWAAEAKASKLTPLEVREVKPDASWFDACPPDAALARLPWLYPEELNPTPSSGSRSLVAVKKGKSADATAGSVSITVLCSSTERVFEVLGEIKDAWSLKPLALAAHGGGRKKDQVARQASAVKGGVSVAVATPGRLHRLLEEGHIAVSGLHLLVLDLGRDRKQRDVLTLPETRKDFFTLLRQHLMPLLTAGSGELRLLLAGSGSGIGDRTAKH